MAKSKGGLRSPMTNDLQAQPNHRMPSTAGTTEMVSTPKVSKQGAKIQSPQSPFGIKSGGGSKK